MGYFGLVFALSVPFYLLGMAHLPFPGLLFLPLSALMTFVPMIAALFLAYRQGGRDAAAALFGQVLDFRKLKGTVWPATALLFIPAVCVIEFIVLRLNGSDLPLPQITLGKVVFLFAAFYVGAIGEELGWQGLAYPGLRQRLSALEAALALGAVWALWHVIPYALMGRSANWIFWHSLNAVAMRVIIVWLFENTRHSILVAVLFHTMINLSWALFPVEGSYYDPFVASLILTISAVAVVCLWGPSTLALFRYDWKGGKDD